MSIWDLLDSLPKRGDVSPEELAARRQGYADLYAGGFLSRNSDQMPLSVQGAQVAQDFIPGIGDAIAFGEAGQALSEGDRRAAALLAAGGLLGVVPGVGDALARPVMAAGRKMADAIPSEALYAGRSLAEGDMRGVLDAFAPSRPAQGLSAEAVEAFDVKRSDASQIFGEGSERVRYTDPQTGGTMEIVVRPDKSASVLDLQVPESSRGKGIGQSLQARVMQDYPEMGGQVSSKAAATTAYRLGRRPYGNPNATLDDVFAAIDDMSSVNLVSPAAQPSPAREVAGLLSSGRANEVTDEMLAKFAPKDEMEMFDLYQRGATGMDLPMDEASRMVRAGEVGAYHGTTSNFPAFDGRAYSSSGFGTHMGDQVAADAILRARRSPYSPKDAPTYVEGSQVLPLRVNAGPMLRVEDTETWNPGATQYAMAWSDDPAAVSAYSAIRENPDYPKFGTDAEQSAFMQKELEGSGFGGFVYDNKFEGGGDSYAVFDPSSIRSRFARFDPRLAHLSNLSAGVGGLGLLSTMTPPEEQY